MIPCPAQYGRQKAEDIVHFIAVVVDFRYVGKDFSFHVNVSLYINTIDSQASILEIFENNRFVILWRGFQL